MYTINSICLLYDNNFEANIEKIRLLEPNLKIITNCNNNFDVLYFETQDKYALIEYCIKNFKNTLFLEKNYILIKKLCNLETYKDLGLMKQNDDSDYSNDCIFCGNLDLIPILKSNNFKNINFISNFFVISNLFIKKQDLTSLFLYYKHNSKRDIEYLTCLKKNLLNSEIDQIYYFSDQEIEFDEIVDNKKKLNFIKYNDPNLSFKNIFDYIKDKNINGYKIITFPDIFFKELNLNHYFSKYSKDYNVSQILFSLSSINLSIDFNLLEKQSYNNKKSGLNHKVLIFEDNLELENDFIKINDFNSINCLDIQLKKENNIIFNICDEIKSYHFDNLKNNYQKKINENINYYFLPNFNKLDLFSIIDDTNTNDVNYKNYNKFCNQLSKFIEIKN